MLNFSEALDKLLAVVPSWKTEEVPLERARNRVLAKEISSDLDLPPFDKAFMDGFALRAEDVSEAPVVLNIVGTQAAGRAQDLAVTPGTAVRIMTGAKVPAGADAVQMVEKTEVAPGDSVVILEDVTKGTHIASAGSETRAGTTVLGPGRLIQAQELAILATVGCASVPVFRAPEAAIVTTGNELIEVDEKPQIGQIRNSNGPMLAAQCEDLGLQTRRMPPVRDDPGQVSAALEEALQCDLVIFSGGVSAGDFDFVHRIVPEHELEVVFHKVAIKPGKPVLVAKCREKLFFGLPGNPVSAFVTFELLVRPAVQRWTGLRSIGLERRECRLTHAIRQKPGRLWFKPARMRREKGTYVVDPVETRGSADIVSFSRANALVPVSGDSTEIPAGSLVNLYLLPGWQEKAESG